MLFTNTTFGVFQWVGFPSASGTSFTWPVHPRAFTVPSYAWIPIATNRRAIGSA
jgi:hypothetical protein